MLFEGIHNFASFAFNKSSRTVMVLDDQSGKRIAKMHDPEFFLRKVERISVKQVDPPLSSNYNPIYDLFDFYTAEFSSKAFFQNQVRIYLLCAQQK